MRDQKLTAARPSESENKKLVSLHSISRVVASVLESFCLEISGCE